MAQHQPQLNLQRSKPGPPDELLNLSDPLVARLEQQLAELDRQIGEEVVAIQEMLRTYEQQQRQKRTS